MIYSKPIFALSLLLCATTSAQAVTDFTIINAPGGVFGTSAAGINAKGDIVGTFYDNTGGHGFVLSKGVFSTLNVSGSIVARGINAQGDIVGSGLTHGFLLSHGTLTSIDPGALASIPFGINARGDIVGWQYFSAGKEFGYLFTARTGTFQTIAPPGWLAQATGINGQNDIVGFYYGLTLPRGFLLTGGTYNNIDVPGALETYPQGINDRGEIVGYFRSDTGTHGFALSNGAFTTIDIDMPGVSATMPRGINSQGDIVGSIIIEGREHGFLVPRDARSR